MGSWVTEGISPFLGDPGGRGMQGFSLCPQLLLPSFSMSFLLSH